VFWVRHPQAKGPLEAWHQEVARAEWAHPSAIKAQYSSASDLPDNRVVFNIGETSIDSSLRLITHFVLCTSVLSDRTESMTRSISPVC